MIFQFVGFKSSGKTTSMEAVIKKLSQKGIRVAAIKHHGHGGIPDTMEKDSMKHREAGAIASIVEGDGVLHLETAKQEWTIERMEALLSYFQYDVLLIEGYKKENYPKFVFLSQEKERESFPLLSNVKFTIPWCEKIEDKEVYINKIVEWIERELHCLK